MTGLSARLRPRRRTLIALSGVLIAISVFAFGASALAGGSPGPATKCAADGWKKLATADGSPFTSGSACVSYANRGGALVTCTVVGTSGDNVFPSVPTGTTTCGFGGNDRAGGVSGTFYGGPGNDRADYVAGTFIGGDGNDSVTGNDPSNGVGFGATFLGGPGDDFVETLNGTFAGGDGNDIVGEMYVGTFFGGGGDDLVGYMGGDAFYGGPGTNRICQGGTGVILDDVIFGCGT